ncbi:hypothetical protein HDV05_002713, partial [Chytridiales sp. JEL 0842]
LSDAPAENTIQATHDEPGYIETWDYASTGGDADMGVDQLEQDLIRSTMLAEVRMEACDQDDDNEDDALLDDIATSIPSQSIISVTRMSQDSNPHADSQSSEVDQQAVDEYEEDTSIAENAMGSPQTTAHLQHAHWLSDEWTSGMIKALLLKDKHNTPTSAFEDNQKLYAQLTGNPYYSHYRLRGMLKKAIPSVNPICFDQCRNGHVAFTGEYANLQACPVCGEPRYTIVKGQTKPVSQFK